MLISTSFADSHRMAPEETQASENVVPEEQKKPLPLMWIPATLGLGLLIALVYLGARIVSAHQVPKATIAQAEPVISKPTVSASKAPDPGPAQVVAATATVAAPPPDVKPEPPPVTSQEADDDGIPRITPLAGQRYIQIGALDPDATRRFVKRLRAESLEPHVAPGPSPVLLRVLIGPFDDRDALKEKKAQLEAEGIDTFVREY
jgi:cell division septation protein DedD